MHSNCFAWVWHPAASHSLWVHGPVHPQPCQCAITCTLGVMRRTLHRDRAAVAWGWVSSAGSLLLVRVPMGEGSGRAGAIVGVLLR
jgi:hypothetical protein